MHFYVYTYMHRVCIARQFVHACADVESFLWKKKKNLHIFTAEIPLDAVEIHEKQSFFSFSCYRIFMIFRENFSHEMNPSITHYGVVSISRLLKIIGLLCRI